MSMCRNKHSYPIQIESKFRSFGDFSFWNPNDHDQVIRYKGVDFFFGDLLTNYFFFSNSKKKSKLK